MNNKGFTLVELVATLVILGLVVGLGLHTLGFNMGNAKKKTEEVFVDTLRDAVDVYLSSEFGNLEKGNECLQTISKKQNETSTKVVKVNEISNNITFDTIIKSFYKPLTMSDFVNPANEDVTCNVNARIKVYIDADFVYYYYIDKSEIGCLNNIGGDYGTVITNLPKVDTNNDGVINDGDGYFTCY